MKYPQIIELIEYKPRQFPPDKIDYDIATKLWQEYDEKGKKIKVEFPTPKTNNKWQFTSQGWVGYIPITPDFHIILKPKVPLHNLFGMLEYVYNLKSFRFLDGLVNCESLQEFYNCLVNILAQKILDRGRKGFYRTYLPKTENLTYIRGRLNMQQVMQKPWNVKFKCDYQEHTANIPDNQILAWTLFIIGRSGFCSENVTPRVSKAFHLLQGLVNLQPFKSSDIVDRKYHRLNEYYQPLHALCRFFLDNIGASHQQGNYSMLPFLIDMAKLYEKFVAEWLKINLPSNLRVQEQEKVDIIDDKISCRIDLVIYEVKTRKVVYILDTKYKLDARPSPDDIHQVVAYATYKKCHEAILVYPHKSTNSINQLVGESQVRLRSLTFAIDSDLEKAGQSFLAELIKYVD
ncbi:MAG: restriction endonuclease [Okeania sp. SIO2C9]|uniref:McrC family protein n=1 Tax=Okeania sp. SIO2C9 TaxID=2607791 RepID=UPI0013C01DC0|nr:restriction endonuclease [Okeania sp. SIO2C9]NEQ76361.1 restriction endonuclease [Okeania sp. SIO2C9]